jgi:hypothetical protein
MGYMLTASDADAGDGPTLPAAKLSSATELLPLVDTFGGDDMTPPPPLLP